MYSIGSPDMSIQQVYWFILAVFFVLVILSWWLANKDWDQEDKPADEHKERNEQPQDLSD